MDIASALESIFFLSTKPLSPDVLAKRCGVPKKDIHAAIEALQEHYNAGKRGLRILENDGTYQMTTAPEHATLVESMIDDEVRSDLTPPQLETLTVIAYRGPLAKHEIELIRGVNCSIIVRNLLMRGLIESREDKTTEQTVYAVSMDFLRTLGVHAVAELPNYPMLHSAEAIRQILDTPAP